MPLTGLGRLTARFLLTADAEFRRAKASPLLRSSIQRKFDPARRAVLTTDTSNIAVAAILTQQDKEGLQHSDAYESRKLTARSGTTQHMCSSCLLWSTP